MNSHYFQNPCLFLQKNIYQISLKKVIYPKSTFRDLNYRNLSALMIKIYCIYIFLVSFFLSENMTHYTTTQLNSKVTFLIFIPNFILYALPFFFFFFNVKNHINSSLKLQKSLNIIILLSLAWLICSHYSIIKILQVMALMCEKTTIKTIQYACQSPNNLFLNSLCFCSCQKQILYYMRVKWIISNAFLLIIMVCNSSFI